MKYRDYSDKLNKNANYKKAHEQLRVNFALGDAVLMARLRRNWSQAQLAALAGTKQANISRIEDGLANPTLEFLKRLFRALGIDMQFIHSDARPSRTTSYVPESATAYQVPNWPLHVSETSSESQGELG